MSAKPSLFHPPLLRTERLLLRRPGAGDVDAIVRIVGDEDVARRLSRVPHPYNRADALFFLEHVVPNEWVWGIARTECAELIGVVGLTPGGQADGAELGYWLSRDHWGKGVMTEAAQAVLSYGFGQLELSCITAGFFADNQASGRILEKLGFLKVGCATRPSLATGADMPSVEMLLARP